MQAFDDGIIILLAYVSEYSKVKEDGEETRKGLYLENEKQFFNQIKKHVS